MLLALETLPDSWSSQMRAPGWYRRLFGIRLLIPHIIFQFTKSIKSSTFHIFFNLTYLLRKIALSQNAQKSPKNVHKTAKQWLWL